MAYEILGTILKIGVTETIQKKNNGGTFNKRQLVLQQRRFDRNTGQEFQPNYPTIDFINNNTAKLDHFKVGDKVRVYFDINGTKSIDEHTRQERFFSSLNGFRVEPYVSQNQQTAPTQNYPPQPYQGQPAYPPQQPLYPPQQLPPQPFPPQNPNNDDPF